jgi:endonuclease YncB( thermonuclease family)
MHVLFYFLIPFLLTTRTAPDVFNDNIFYYKAVAITDGTRWIDGDTFWAKILEPITGDTIREPIRLAYIDTPELHGDDHDAAVEATDYLISLIDDELLIIKLDKNNFRGVFGRLIGEIYRASDTLNINKEMLASGHAEPYKK